ncbi:MAG: hypothetical protein WKG00_39940 [Polyangiaceae bacterium]
MNRRLLALLFLSLPLAACADDPCGDALQKLEDCAVAGGREPLQTDTCEGREACMADCIDEAECEEMLGSRPDSAFQSCANACAALQVE